MPALGSPEWVHAIDGALRATPRPAGTTGRTVVEYRIVEGDGSTTTYHVSADAEGYAASTGSHPDATATITMSRSVADAVARGERDTHTEMLMGTIAVEGDAVALIGAGADIAVVRDAVASVPVEADR